MLEGGCHCGAIRYRVSGPHQHVSFCHCRDCRRCAGAPLVAWSAFATENFELLAGEPALYRSSPNARRYFCPVCGSGMYYVNETVMPGLVDIQIATLDDPEALRPQLHVQVAERLSWMRDIAGLPQCDGFPT